MLYGSSRRRLKGLSTEDKHQLTVLSYGYRELYNASLQIIRQKVDLYGLPPYFGTLAKEVQKTAAYAKLGEPYIAAIGLALDNAHQTFKAGKLPREKRQSMSIVLRNPIILAGKAKVPATEKTKEFWLPVADFAAEKDVFQVLICPVEGGEEWEVIARYRIPEPEKTASGECLGIDMGISNLATLACSNGATAIIDGKKLKSILYADYRKRRSGTYTADDCIRHRNRVDDYVCKAALVVLQFCKENRVSKVLIGQGDTTSKERRQMRLSKLWPDFPLAQFAQRVIDLCRRAGIDAQIIDESFTSKASFLDNDPIPWRYSKGPHQFSGTRRCRGLYVSKITGVKINADVNGAFNLLRKHNACSLVHLQREPKLIQQPKRLQPLNYKPNGTDA